MLLPILILATLILFNGFFAMSELAMMTSRQSRLERSAQAGHAGASTALRLSREPSRFLSTVQVAITLIGVLAGAFGENALSGEVEALLARVPLIEGHTDTLALVIVVLGITYFSLVVGELIPKRIALAFPEATASFIAPPLQGISKITAIPVRILTLSTDLALRVLRIPQSRGEDVSEEDVRSLMDRAVSTGVFTPQELNLFQRTMRLGDLTVRDLMVARADIVWIDEKDPISTIRVLVGTNPYSHFPICRDGPESILGVVHIKDLISHGLLAGTEFKIADVMRPPLYIPETLPALSLLESLQNSTTHIAFVVDEYGVTEGLITLNDIARATVGLEQAHPAHPDQNIRIVSENEFYADGRLPLLDLVKHLGMPPETRSNLPGISTTAGLVASLLGKIPDEGDAVPWSGYLIEVLDMDGTRIDKLRFTRQDEHTP